MNEMRQFFEKYKSTLGTTVADMIGLRRELACFQIARVAQEKAPVPCTLEAGLLVLNDNPKSPIVLGHCVLEYENAFYDFAFTGPGSYGLDPTTDWEFLPKRSNPLSQFGRLTDGIADNYRNGVTEANKWWDAYDETAQQDILTVCDLALDGLRIFHF